MGAASYYNNQRFTRPRTRKEYFAWLEKFKQQGGKLDTPYLSQNDKLLETLMLGLRLKEGVNLATITSQFGIKIKQQILKCLAGFLADNLITYDDNTQQLSLTDPEGFLYSNTVLTALFSELEIE